MIQKAITAVVNTDQLLDLTTLFDSNQKVPSSVMIVVIPQEQNINDPDWIVPPANHDEILAQTKKEREAGKIMSHGDLLAMLKKRGGTL